MAYKTSNLEELIYPLRIHIGDIAATPVYSDEVLHSTLRVAVSALMLRWYDKYYVDVDGVVHRNPSTSIFSFSSPPVIQNKDWMPIILQASIMLKSGKKFSESGNAISWRDDEISYSAIEAGKQRSDSLKDDIDALEKLLPSKKLARTLYGRLYPRMNDYDK